MTNLTVIHMTDLTFTMERPCPVCGQISQVTVDQKGFNSWMAGALIQNALPLNTADEREVLKTGICSSCWDNMFKED